MLKTSFFSPARPRRAEARFFPWVVLASFRPSPLRRCPPEVEGTGEAFPFAGVHFAGERSTKSADGTFSVIHSLQPCWRNLLSILQSCRQSREATVL